MGITNGYIVKFYKKIIEPKDKNKNFDFVSFMNFDGVRIIDVEKFSDYQSNTIDFSAPQNEDTDCSRQKLYIYNFNQKYSNIDGDIFDKNPNGILKEFPVLAITIINLKGEVVQNKYDSIIEQADKTLANIVNDLVIVFRCKSFTDLFQCNIHSLFPESDSFYSTYTIPCLSLSNSKFWKEEDLAISIRASIPPQAQYYNMSDNGRHLKINGKKVYGLKNVTKYNVFGKYDVDVRGKIKSTREFINNFNDGLFSDINADNRHINRRTNTRFLYECKKGNCETNDYYPYTINPKINNFKETISEISSQIIDKSSLHSDFTNNLTRLWLRAYQLLLRGRDNPILEDVSCIIEKYFNLTLQYINDLDRAESVVLGLTSLNTLIDNRDLNDFYEFENPHSNLMFAGCSTALLCAYSNMSNIAFKLIKKLNNESKEYYSFITSDGYAEVSTKEIFEENDDCYLINICIPTELMFNFKDLVCLIFHEIGHNWNYSEEKDRIETFLDISLKQQLINVSGVKDVFTFKKKDAVKNFALNCLYGENCIDSMRIHKAVVEALDYNSDLNLISIYEIADVVLSDVKELDQAVNEAIPDIFMLKFINIRDPKFYLNVVLGYLDYKNIQFASKDFSRESLNAIFIRVIIVLLFLTADSSFDREQCFNIIRKKLCEYCISAKNESNKKEFVKQLLDFISYDNSSLPVFHYACELYEEIVLKHNTIDAVEFRQKFNFDDNDIKKIQENFEKYLNAKDDESNEKFKAIIDFITEINAMH